MSDSRCKYCGPRRTQASPRTAYWTPHHSLPRDLRILLIRGLQFTIVIPLQRMHDCTYVSGQGCLCPAPRTGVFRFLPPPKSSTPSSDPGCRTACEGCWWRTACAAAHIGLPCRGESPWSGRKLGNRRRATPPLVSTEIPNLVITQNQGGHKLNEWVIKVNFFIP